MPPYIDCASQVAADKHLVQDFAFATKWMPYMHSNVKQEERYSVRGVGNSQTDGDDKYPSIQQDGDCW